MLEEIIIKCSRLVLRQVRQLEVLFEYWSGIQLPFKSPTFSCPVFRCYSKIRTFALYHLKFGLVWYSAGRIKTLLLRRKKYCFCACFGVASAAPSAWLRQPLRLSTAAAAIDEKDAAIKKWN